MLLHYTCHTESLEFKGYSIFSALVFYLAVIADPVNVLSSIHPMSHSLSFDCRHVVFCLLLYNRPDCTVHSFPRWVVIYMQMLLLVNKT